MPGDGGGSDSIEGFQSIRLKFRAENEHGHQLFFKPHSVRVLEPTKPADRTLFCANIPPWATKEAIERIFKVNGSIENVYLEFEPNVGAPPSPSNRFYPAPVSKDPYRTGNGFKFAYIVFDRANSIRNCMTKMKLDGEYICSTKDHPVATGIEKWSADYNSRIHSIKDLLEDVQQYMNNFDEEAFKKQEAEEEMGEADEDGWVTVTSNNKHKASKAKKEEELAGRKVRKNNNRRKMRKKTELKNFYAHQIKDEKINNIRELRKKFEEDKLKIAQMKSDRKFRPF
eukprot:TRINITY_DN4545_c0_g1_i1.p1 TRINITY_DN4545_c0_g1~~TRINITY_DN4545_c0_g1_i1.p1  ORF type:complete len:284 (-),score=68.88 TRINITY_DN4545_c0_g1_i1:64-915(-)